MTITPMYLPTSGQADAQSRATAVGANLTTSDIPPVYAQAVQAGGGAPGVVAEYNGAVVYLSDSPRTVTATQVTSLIAPLVAKQTADATAAANAAAINANILSRQSQIQAWLTANPNGAVLTAAQTRTLALMLNGLCQLLLNQYSSTTNT